MTLSRRQALGAAVALPIAARATAAPPVTMLPDKAGFVASPVTYLDNASTHPVSIGARKTVEGYLASRTLDPAAPPSVDRAKVIAKFAALVNADADEITWVQSTTMGEQAVLRALGFPGNKERIVTDTLHFYAAFPMYQEMAGQGVDVAWVRHRDSANGVRIDLSDMEKAITPGTKLVSLSLVSTYNGFRHDLKAVCDMAHRVGALVYADIIHAAGAMPVDLHGSGVDFAASATYKWLMGDFGLGFLYARRGVADALPRREYGYFGFARPGSPPGIGLSPPDTHIYPLDPAGAAPTSYDERGGAIGHFATGTYAQGVAWQLDHSLDYIARLGVPAIQAHAQGLLAPLRVALKAKGYRVVTPADSGAPILSAVVPGAKALLAGPLDRARVRISIHDNHIRMSPSVHNDAGDIDRLIAALPKI